MFVDEKLILGVLVLFTTLLIISWLVNRIINERHVTKKFSSPLNSGASRHYNSKVFDAPTMFIPDKEIGFGSAKNIFV